LKAEGCGLLAEQSDEWEMKDEFKASDETATEKLFSQEFTHQRRMGNAMHAIARIATIDRLLS
jgi:hypothetical protein